MTPQGQITEFSLPNTYSQAGEITTGPDGNLWFTQTNQIGRITPQGIITEFPLPTEPSSPSEITKGPDGNLWFTQTSFGGNSETGKIGRITPTGTITEFPIPTGIAEGITTGPDGEARL